MKIEKYWSIVLSHVSSAKNECLAFYRFYKEQNTESDSGKRPFAHEEKPWSKTKMTAVQNDDDYQKYYFYHLFLSFRPPKDVNFLTIRRPNNF